MKLIPWAITFGLTALSCSHPPKMSCPLGMAHEFGSACAPADGRIASVIFSEPGEVKHVMYPIARTVEEYESAASHIAEKPYEVGSLWLSSTFWSDSGRLSGINVHLRGTNRTVSILFHDNGIQSLYTELENGKSNGLIRSWHRNGILKWTGQMRDDHPDGVHLHWDESGQFKKQMVWDMGEFKFESKTPARIGN